MDPTKFAPRPPETPEESKPAAKTGKQGDRTVSIGSKRSVLANSRIEQTIKAQPKEAPSISSTHEVSRELDPKSLFIELAVQSKKTFQNQQTLDPRRDKFHAQFSDIPCIRETAVQVGNRFLHANHVTLNEIPFIACSAPQNKDRELFWRAVFENADSIIDVSGLGEVEGYFPEEEGKKMAFGKMTITCKNAGPPHVYSISDGQKEKTVTRMHFSTWPDHGVIRVDELESLVHGYKTFCSQGTTLCHCRAGLGRTGTIMVAVAIKDLFDKGLLTQENAVKTVENLVLDARRQRGPSTVQVDEQLGLLCDYAKKLATEGPDTHFDLQKTLTDTRKISTVEQALELVKKVRDGKVTPDEQNSLGSALKIIAEVLQSGIEIDKGALGDNLKAIKESAISAQDISRGYAVVNFDESTEEEPSLRDLTTHEKSMVDFTRMLLETKVPREVLDHPAYVGTFLFTLGSAGVDRMHLPADELRTQAIANAALFLKGAFKLSPGQMHYMLTPSTVTTGPEGYEPFTLRFITTEGRPGNVRLVKSPTGWQELGVTADGKPNYAALAKAPVYKSVDDLINHVLKGSKAAAVTKDEAMKQKGVIIGSESIQVPDLLLRGLCLTPKIQAEDVGPDEPFLIESFSAEIVRSCFDTLLFGLPLQADIKQAGLLAEFLWCDQLKQEVSLAEVQQPSKEYTVSSTKHRLEKRLSLNDKLYDIVIGENGSFKVKGSEVTYPNLARLVRDIKQAELLRTSLEKQKLFDFQPNPKAFPMRPFAVEAKALSMAPDGTFTLGEQKGLKTLEEVKAALTGRATNLAQLQNQLQRLNAFVPGATLEQAKELLKGQPDATFLIRQHGPGDIRLVYIDSSEIQEARLEIFPNGFRIRPEDDRYGTGVVDNNVAALVESQTRKKAAAYNYPLNDMPAYHGNLSEEELKKIPQEGQYLLRMSSDPSKGIVLTYKMGGRTENQRVQFSEQGIQLAGSKTWYKTPEELFEARLKKPFTAVPNTKAQLLEIIKKVPPHAVKNSLAAAMAEIWMNSSQKYTPEDLFGLVADQKGIRLPSVDEIKAKAHELAVSLLRELCNPESALYATHESLNAALRSVTVVVGGFTKEEQAEFAAALPPALSEGRPEIWIKSDEAAFLNREFKASCTTLWQQLGLGEFLIEWK